MQSWQGDGSGPRSGPGNVHCPMSSVQVDLLSMPSVRATVRGTLRTTPERLSLQNSDPSRRSDCIVFSLPTTTTAHCHCHCHCHCTVTGDITSHTDRPPSDISHRPPACREDNHPSTHSLTARNLLTSVHDRSIHSARSKTGSSSLVPESPSQSSRPYVRGYSPRFLAFRGHDTGRRTGRRTG